MLSDHMSFRDIKTNLIPPRPSLRRQWNCSHLDSISEIQYNRKHVIKELKLYHTHVLNVKANKYIRNEYSKSFNKFIDTSSNVVTKKKFGIYENMVVNKKIMEYLQDVNETHYVFSGSYREIIRIPNIYLVEC